VPASTHRGEYGDPGPVVEQALAVEDGLEPTRGPQLTEKVDDRNRVGGGDYRAEQEAVSPVQAEREMRKSTDQRDGEEDAESGKQRDRHHSPPQLLEVERERCLEDQAGHEREKDEVGADGRKA